MAHHTNLVVAMLSFLRLVSKVENLQFQISKVLHQEFCKQMEILESKGKKFLKNIKTQWISMLSSCRRVFAKYKLLVMKMAEDNGHFENAKTNYELLWDVETC